MSFRPIRDARGNAIGVEFVPTLKMYRVITIMNRAENSHLSHEQILKKAKVSPFEWAKWENDFVIHEYGTDGAIIATKNHFSEWFENALEIRTGEEREMLRIIGLEKAMAGEFNYWDRLSKTYGTIRNEAPPPERKGIPFTLPANPSKEQLIELKNKLMESQRSVGDKRGAGLARLTAKQPKGART